MSEVTKSNSDLLVIYKANDDFALPDDFSTSSFNGLKELHISYKLSQYKIVTIWAVPFDSGNQTRFANKHGLEIEWKGLKSTTHLPPRKTFKKYLKLSWSYVTALVAIFATLEILKNHYSELYAPAQYYPQVDFTNPDRLLEGENIEFEISTKNIASYGKGVVNNHGISIAQVDTDLRLDIKDMHTTGPSKQILPGESVKIKSQLKPLDSGEYKLLATMSAHTSLFGPKWRQVIEKEFEVWPKLDCELKEISPSESGLCRLRYEIITGEEHPKGVILQIKVPPSEEFNVYGVFDTMGSKTIEKHIGGSEAYTFFLKQTPHLEAFKRNYFDIVLKSNSGANPNWDSIAKIVSISCRKNTSL